MTVTLGLLCDLVDQPTVAHCVRDAQVLDSEPFDGSAHALNAASRLTNKSFICNLAPVYERRDILTCEGLGIALREARRVAGLSQHDAAALASTTRPTISSVERGQGGLSVRTLLSLLDAYGCALRIVAHREDEAHLSVLSGAVSATPLVPRCPATR